MPSVEHRTEIECPKCGERFSVTDAIASEVKVNLEEQYQARLNTLLTEFDEKEKDLKARSENVAHAEELFDQKVKTAVEKDKAELLRKAEATVRAATQLEIDDMKNQLGEQASRLEDSKNRELELRSRVREVEDREKQLDLEIQRKADEQAEKVKLDVVEEYATKLKLQAREFVHKEEGLKRQVEELTRKLEQGSQQTRGEVQELVLEDELRTAFPLDDIKEVPKGKKGADAVQVVLSVGGATCGKIVWESKRTKGWSEAWVQKAKDDQRDVKADAAVIVSKTLPSNVKGFGQVDGVWVADFGFFVQLGSILRFYLQQMLALKMANIGKNEKMEVIYQYLSGNEFRQRVLAIMEAFRAMKIDLDKEKVAMTKHWAKREKEIDRVVAGIVGMYGDLEGIMGAGLPRIEGLEISDQRLLSEPSEPSEDGVPF